MPPWYVLACGGVALLCIIGSSAIRHRLKSERAQNLSNKLFDASFVPVTIFFVGVMFSTVPTLVEFYLPALFDSTWAAVAAMIVGLLLFWLRKAKPARYAALEILGALATMTVCGSSQYGTPYQRGTALLAATYFLIRGLDNADKGNLLGRLATRARTLAALDRRRLALIALVFIMFPIGLAASIASKKGLSPPYLDTARGGGIPVSALECGDLWVVCDEAAWRRREALIRGSAKDRARDKIDVDARVDAYLCKHESTAPQ